MAYPFVSGGLNDIIGLSLTSDEDTGGRVVHIAMDKTGSRIPKVGGFGFRKPVGKPGHLSEGNSPRGVSLIKSTVPPGRPITPTDSHSAPGSQNTSPNLSRSKSLRVPRSKYHNVKIQPTPSAVEHNQSSDNEVEETPPRLPVRSKLKPPAEIVGERAEIPSLSRPRSKTMGSGLVRPSLRSSYTRSMSPHTGWKDKERAVDAEEEEEEDDFVGSPQPEGEDTGPLMRDRRTKSFSAKARTQLTNGNAPLIVAPSSSTPMTRANSMRRSKTPTSLTTSIRSNYSVERAGSSNGSQADRPPQGRLVRTGSQGHMGKYNTKLTPPSQPMEKVQLRRTVHSSKPPRPLSSYICEEGSQSAVDDDGGKNWKGKRSHSSMDYNQMPDTHSPQQPGSGRVTPTRTARFLVPKNRTPSLEGSGGSSGGSRPRSATAHYQQARRLSLTHKETAASKPELSQDVKRGSTPSSGRSTPVLKGGARESTDGGMMSTTVRSSGLPPRTPYRVARTKAAPTNSLAGMNELEGSVLLEADDYRRLVNEVKALKTALLKLKRELQEESDDPPSPLVRRAKTAPFPGQMTPRDQNKKLEAVGKERDAATSEVSRLQKEVKAKDSKIEALDKELAEVRDKSKGMQDELKCVSEQRGRLVDKVERLHAEKHQIEARLNTLERASMYEQTWSNNWLDELDGEDDEALRQSLENDKLSFSEGGRTKGSSGSDVVDSGMQSDGDVDENSEPEGLAISYTAPTVM